MQQPKPKLKIKLEDVCFYFDGVERDRMDCSGVSRKSAEILALRDKLLSLPEQTFEVAVNTMKSLVKDMAKGGEGDEDGRAHARKRRTDAAALLYQETSAGRGASGSVQKVSAS